MKINLRWYQYFKARLNLIDKGIVNRILLKIKLTVLSKDSLNININS